MSKGIIVQKYGGTSVADISRIENVARRVVKTASLGYDVVVIVSALGTLAAMLALYDLTHEALGEDGGMRAVFYLLIFPTSFFFVQVYTEGLFVGLALACLALLKRKHLVYAALLGAAAAPKPGAPKGAGPRATPAPKSRPC